MLRMLEAGNLITVVASRHSIGGGEHGVLRMADIVRDMVDVEHLTFEQIMDRCGMEKKKSRASTTGAA